MEIKHLNLELKDNWNEYIATIWKNIFIKIGLPRYGTIVEIAPGEVNKIGKALEMYGFKGTLIIIEPNEKSLNNLTKEYNSKFKDINLIGINRELKDSIKLLPNKVDAILSNHPLDDMIIGKFLKDKEFNNFFDNCYENYDLAHIKKIWDKVESSNNAEEIKNEVGKEFIELFNKTNPEIVIISQYESYFFKTNKIDYPDKIGFELLNKLKIENIGTDYSKVLDNIKEINDKERWALFRPCKDLKMRDNAK